MKNARPMLFVGMLLVALLFVMLIVTSLLGATGILYVGSFQDNGSGQSSIPATAITGGAANQIAYWNATPQLAAFPTGIGALTNDGGGHIGWNQILGNLNNFQSGNITLSNFAGLANAAGVLTNNGSGTFSWVAVGGGSAGASGTSNALVLYANYSPGSNLLINFSNPAYTNVANLVYRVTATNGLVISFTNVPDGLSFVVDVMQGSFLTNTVAFNTALASTNLFPVRFNETAAVTVIPTTSTNSHILSSFTANGTNICLASQSLFSY